MIKRQLRTIVLVLCSSLIVGGQIAHSADVDDGWRQTLREGIEARESAIHSLRIKYTVVTEHTELEHADAKKYLKAAVEDGTMSQTDVDRRLALPWSAKTVRKIELLTSDGKIATTRAEVTPYSDSEPNRTVFDGEIMTQFGGSTGWRRRATLADALPQPTIDSLCQGIGGSLPELFKLPLATCTLLPPAAGRQDVLFQATFATADPQDENEMWMNRSEVTAEINATKSFWPQHLVEAFVKPAYGKPDERYVLREVRLSDFRKAGGIDFPHKIEEINSDLRNVTDASGDVGVACEVINRITLVVDDVAINEPVDASEFVINFPPGARYLDLDGDTKIVEPDGTIRNRSAELAGQSLFTEDTSGGPLAASARAWHWLPLAAATLLLVVAALCSFRYLRARPRYRESA